MFLEENFRASGEPSKPERKLILSSRGYPAVRDP
jgi:hypothetical protein